MNAMFNEMSTELTDKKNNMKHIIEQTNILNKEKYVLNIKYMIYISLQNGIFMKIKIINIYQKELFVL